MSALKNTIYLQLLLNNFKCFGTAVGRNRKEVSTI